MSKTLVREVPFGKAIARITVSAFTNDVNFDGYIMGQKLHTTQDIEIVANGKVVVKETYAKKMTCNVLYEDQYEKYNLNENDVFTRVGNVRTLGFEAFEAIEGAIVEMKDKLAKEFGEKTETEKADEEVAKAEAEAIEMAEKVVAAAEVEGVKNLRTREQLKTWRKAYNDVNNEGGEGYIPTRVSKEQYEEALKVLGRDEVCKPEEKSDLRKAIESVLYSDVTATGLAEQTGITQAAITQYRTGARKIENMTLLTIKRLLKGRVDIKIK